MLAFAVHVPAGRGDLMASDLADRRRAASRCSCAATRTSRTSASATPERRLVFDLNDFDETHPGPFEWDVKRLAASIVAAARDRGFVDAAQAFAARAAARSYRAKMLEFAEMGFLDVWYSRIDADEALQCRPGQQEQEGC